MVAVLTVPAALKTKLFYQNDTIIVFFFTDNKKWSFLMLNYRILGLIWQRTTYFVVHVNDTTSYLVTAIVERFAEHGQSIYKWHQIKILKT